VRRRDLLGRHLVEGVVVGGLEHVRVAERDLVLPEVALALGRLHAQPGGVHGVADVAQQRLHPAGSHDRVVDVVPVRRRQAAVPLVPGLVERILEDQELQLRARDGAEPHRGGLLDLAREDLPRRLDHRRAVEPQHVALDDGRRRQPGGAPHRGQVRPKLEVPVAALPAGDRVPADRVHVDVHGEQVVARLGAVPEHLVEEVPGVQPLALQPPLDVGETGDDGVDLTCVDERLELGHLQATGG
jgi:hypothetical protein